jgi:hypothetical protein
MYSSYQSGSLTSPNTLQQPPAETYSTKTVFIDGRDGNGSTFDYVVYFDAPGTSVIKTPNGNADGFVNDNDIPKHIGCGVFKNVVKVKLKSILFPKILNEEYVVLDIAELNENFYSSDNGCNMKAAMMYFDHSELPCGLIKANYNSWDFNLTQSITLSKLHIKFKKYGGDLVTTNDTNNKTNHSLLLEITSVNNRYF